MVMARLHTICGNCGCNDMFELSIDRDAEYWTKEGDFKRDTASLTCKNCATIHFLNEDGGIEWRDE